MNTFPKGVPWYCPHKFGASNTCKLCEITWEQHHGRTVQHQMPDVVTLLSDSRVGFRLHLGDWND